MSSNPASSYALMRQYYKKSNEYLVQALEIDESGQGRVEIYVKFNHKAYDCRFN